MPSALAQTVSKRRTGEHGATKAGSELLTPKCRLRRGLTFLQSFKRAQQEIYDESDYNLKQVGPLAVGEFVVHGSCLGYALLR